MTRRCPQEAPSSAAATPAPGFSPSRVEKAKPPGVEGPRASAAGALRPARMALPRAMPSPPRRRPAAASRGCGSRRPRSVSSRSRRGRPSPSAPPSGRREGSPGRARAGGAPAIKRGRLPRRPGLRDPGQSDRRARAGRSRAAAAETPEALGSPGAGAGAGGGAGPGDAGLGEDGDPRPGRVELLPRGGRGVSSGPAERELGGRQRAAGSRGAGARCALPRGQGV